MKAVNEGRIGMTDSVVQTLGPVHPMPGLRGCVSIRCPLRQPDRGDDGPGRAKESEVGILPEGWHAGLALNHILPNQGPA